MLAARIHETGGADKVRLEQVDLPAPARGELKVRIAAAGLNPIDWKLREGAFPVKLPMTLGHDVAGVVEAIGEGGAQGFEVGARVFGMLSTEGGGYAEAVDAPASWFAVIPSNLDLIDAAAVPMGALTASKALFDVAGLKDGERVLVHGAGGAVGGMAVQLAKARGCWVAATASGADAATLRQRGIDLVIDHKTEPFEAPVKAAGGVDLVLDVLAGATRDRSWAVLRDGGRMVSTLGATTPPPADAARGVRGLPGFGAQPDGAVLATIAALIAQGKVRVTKPSEVLPLERAAEAMELIQHGGAKGKVVLRTGTDQ